MPQNPLAAVELLHRLDLEIALGSELHHLADAIDSHRADQCAGHLKIRHARGRYLIRHESTCIAWAIRSSATPMVIGCDLDDPGLAVHHRVNRLE